MLLKRDIFNEIVKYLDSDNIIVLHGARQVGKTHIMQYIADYLQEKKKDSFFFDLEDGRYLEILDRGVEAMLAFLMARGVDLDTYKKNKRRFFVFVDEIQYLKNPSSFLKLIADHYKYLQLIVSGSSSFAIKSKFSDSLVGRTVNFEIFNLSFVEFLRFREIALNLQKLDDYHLTQAKQLFIEYVIQGAYPKIVLEKSLEKKEKYLQQIIDTYVRKDINALASVKNIDKFNLLLKVLARQSGQLLRVTDLAAMTGLSKDTIENYLFILENTYIIKLLRPFSRNAAGEVVKMPKVFFYDTGLLSMLRSNDLRGDLDGGMFETAVFTELNKKYGHENLHYWRNKSQNEIDFIIEYKQEIIPVEVKTNFGKFKRSSMDFFVNKYGIKKFVIVGIEGKITGKDQKYPWEI